MQVLYKTTQKSLTFSMPIVKFNKTVAKL